MKIHRYVDLERERDRGTPSGTPSGDPHGAPFGARCVVPNEVLHGVAHGATHGTPHVVHTTPDFASERRTDCLFWSSSVEIETAYLNIYTYINIHITYVCTCIYIHILSYLELIQTYIYHMI